MKGAQPDTCPLATAMPEDDRTPRQAYDDGHEAHCENDLGTEREHEAFVQVYFLVLPEGMSEPLRHTEAAPMKRAANKG